MVYVSTALRAISAVLAKHQLLMPEGPYLDITRYQYSTLSAVPLGAKHASSRESCPDRIIVVCFSRPSAASAMAQIIKPQPRNRISTLLVESWRGLNDSFIQGIAQLAPRRETTG